MRGLVVWRDMMSNLKFICSHPGYSPRLPELSEALGTELAARIATALGDIEVSLMASAATRSRAADAPTRMQIGAAGHLVAAARYRLSSLGQPAANARGDLAAGVDLLSQAFSLLQPIVAGMGLDQARSPSIADTATCGRDSSFVTERTTPVDSTGN